MYFSREKRKKREREEGGGRVCLSVQFCNLDSGYHNRIIFLDLSFIELGYKGIYMNYLWKQGNFRIIIFLKYS